METLFANDEAQIGFCADLVTLLTDVWETRRMSLGAIRMLWAWHAEAMEDRP